MIRQAAHRQKELENQRQEVYMVQRKRTKKQLWKRTAKGQPVMKTQIEHLLSKINREIKDE